MKKRKIKLFIRNILIKSLFHIFYIFPIKNNKIVFCNFYGNGYGDSPKYIANELCKLDKNIDMVWLVKKGSDVSAIPLNIRTVRFRSIKSIFELSTAKVWIDNARKIQDEQKRNGQYYIQTWHGAVGPKRVEKEVEKELDPYYVKWAKADSKMVDVFLSNCKKDTILRKNVFWYDGEVWESGHPRNDILVLKDEDKILEIKRKLHISLDKKILLYAPTFRKDYKLDCYKLDYNNLLNNLKQKFGGDWVIFLRLHPNIQDLANNIIYNEKVINMSNYPDIQELCLVSDIMISDYSSVMFDYVLTKRPVFIFATDIKEYIKDRNFCIDLYKLPFTVSQNNIELFDNILNFNNHSYQINLQKFFDEIGFVEDGKASTRIVNRILKIIKLL